MLKVRELFELAKTCYAESNRVSNPDVSEKLREKGDQYMRKADELRRIEITQGVFPSDKRV
ncbi:MAG TPA: hypothetical protein VFP60_17285 [Pseudolabrys sp.]|nr:hypothetical protein [Pseudolabrys sp.]